MPVHKQVVSLRAISRKVLSVYLTEVCVYLGFKKLVLERTGNDPAWASGHENGEDDDQGDEKASTLWGQYLRVLGFSLGYQEAKTKLDCDIASVRHYYDSNIPHNLRNQVYEEATRSLRHFVLHFDSKIEIPAPIFDTVLAVMYDSYVTEVNMKSLFQNDGNTLCEFERCVTYSRVSRNLLKVPVDCNIYGGDTVIDPHSALVHIPSVMLEHLSVLDVGATSHGPDLVWGVGCRCPNLRHLILGTGRWFPPDERISAALGALAGEQSKAYQGRPIGCKNLRSLRLDSVCGKLTEFCSVFAKMLMFMPHLEILTGAPILLTLNHYVEGLKESKPVRPLQLKNIDDRTDYDFYGFSVGQDYPINPRSSKFWSKLLPDVQEVLVDSLHKMVGEFMSSLKKLAKVTICKASDYPSRFVFLRASFDSLRSLSLGARQLDGQSLCNLLKDIQESSPSLEELKLSCCGFELHTLNLAESALFPSLQSLTLDFVSVSNIWEITDFVKRCPVLGALQCNIHWVGGPLDEWLETTASYMPNLQRLCLDLTCFTIDIFFFTWESMESLLRFCPKLNYVGMLRYWSDGLDMYTEFTERARNNNWDLTVSY